MWMLQSQGCGDWRPHDCACKQNSVHTPFTLSLKRGQQSTWAMGGLSVCLEVTESQSIVLETSSPCYFVTDCWGILPVLPKRTLGWGREGREGGGQWGWVYADSSATSKQSHPSWEGKWRTSAGSPEGDVTAPESLISGGNGGVEDHPGVASAWLQHINIKDLWEMTTHGLIGLKQNGRNAWYQDFFSPSLRKLARFSKCMVMLTENTVHLHVFSRNTWFIFTVQVSREWLFKSK